jgi:hypothetical protein
MRQIAFLSLDPVHEEYARTMASAQGAELEVWFPKDASRFSEFAGVICDLDYWPGEQPDQWLSELKTNLPSCHVAVFSYTLNAKRAEALRRRGIAVFRELSPRVFSDLRR